MHAVFLSSDFFTCCIFDTVLFLCVSEDLSLFVFSMNILYFMFIQYL